MDNTDSRNAQSEATFVVPRTETERVVLEIWSVILQRDGIGIYDDFLDLGGDSLAAMRCVNQIRAAFGVDVPLDVLFVEPAHVVEVASHIDRMRCENVDGDEAPSAVPQ